MYTVTCTTFEPWCLDRLAASATRLPHVWTSGSGHVLARLAAVWRVLSVAASKRHLHDRGEAAEEVLIVR